VALYFLTSGRLVDWNFREFSGNSEFDQSLENLFSTINFIHELREMPDWLFDEYFIPFLLVITPEDFKNKKNWIEKTQKLPIPVHVPKPTYPFTAEVNTTEGYAIIAFTITKKGKVKDLALIKESPSFKEFGKSSMKAAKGLRFDPILVNGKPEEVRSSYKYTFQIGK
jgi:TonB family protein